MPGRSEARIKMFGNGMDEFPANSAELDNLVGDDSLLGLRITTTTTWANVSGDNATYLYGESTAALTSRIDIQPPNAQMFGVYNSKGGVKLSPDKSDPFDTSNFPSAKYPYAFEVFGNNGTTPRSSTPTNSANHSLDDLAG